MGDILDDLRVAHKWLPRSDRPSLYSAAAAEIERLRADYYEMVDQRSRWKADADRLAGQVKRVGCACNHDPDASDVSECDACAVLRLHDKEVEAP